MHKYSKYSFFILSNCVLFFLTLLIRVSVSVKKELEMNKELFSQGIMNFNNKQKYLIFVSPL